MKNGKWPTRAFKIIYRLVPLSTPVPCHWTVPLKRQNLSNILNTFFSIKKQVLNSQSWALALYFQVRSPLISYPWIAIALALIWPIFRFAHRSITLKKPVVRSRKRALKCKIAPKTTAVRSYVCIGTYICT